MIAVIHTITPKVRQKRNPPLKMKASCQLRLLLVLSALLGARSDHSSDKKAFIEEESSRCAGHQIELGGPEKNFNETLMTLKLEDYDWGIQHPDDYLLSRPLLNMTEEIKQTKVFELIAKLPKGAVCSPFLPASLSIEAFLNLTKLPHLFGCFTEKFYMRFFPKGPEKTEECDYWVPFEFLWAEIGREGIEMSVSLDPKNWLTDYSNVNSVKEVVTHLAYNFQVFIKYRPALEAYLRTLMNESLANGIFYVETRYHPQESFDEEENVYSISDTLQYMRSTVEAFKENNTDFEDLKLIYCVNGTSETLEKDVDDFLDLLPKFKDFVVGFCLSGYEDEAQPLSQHAPLLQKVQAKTKLILTVAETNQYGTFVDENLVSAILLNASRLVTAFTIDKHPKVLNITKKKGIAVELSPVSTQLFLLNGDFRNYPYASLGADDYPFVASCDAPTMYRVDMSLVWYVVWSAMTSREADLRVLKQLGENAVEYCPSSLEPERKKELRKRFEDRWQKVMEDFQNNE